LVDGQSASGGDDDDDDEEQEEQDLCNSFGAATTGLYAAARVDDAVNGDGTPAATLEPEPTRRADREERARVCQSYARGEDAALFAAQRRGGAAPQPGEGTLVLLQLQVEC
jgi:hypothetical protein